MPFHLIKGAGVKLPEPDDHAACGTEPEIRFVDTLEFATETDPSNLLSSSHAERVELAGSYRLQSRSGRREDLESWGRGGRRSVRHCSLSLACQPSGW